MGSSCWSILGDTDAAPEHGLYGLKTIDNGLSYGNWDGEKRRCYNELDNFLHVKHGNGHKGYLTVEQMRDINVNQAGIASGFSCTHVGSVVRFKDISVAYYNNGDTDDEYIRISNVELQYGVVYAIKSVSSGFYLDGRNQNYNNPVLTNRNPEGDKYLHWTIVPTNVENQFALKSVSSGFYLDGRNEYLNNPLITNRDTADDYYLQWTFEKTNGTMEELDKSITTEYIGCYQDTAYRALRHGPPTFGYTPDTCSTACKDYKYFAVQAGGWCFCDDDYDHATRYGEAGGCPASKMGAEWRNDLFLNEMPNNVAIRSVSSQKYLDGRNGEIDPLLTNGNPMDDKHLQWQFIAQ